METTGKKKKSEFMKKTEEELSAENRIIHTIVENLFDFYDERSFINDNKILTVVGGVLFSCLLTLCDGDREEALNLLDSFYAAMKLKYRDEDASVIYVTERD